MALNLNVGSRTSLSAPADDCFVITPDDEAELPLGTKGLRAPSDGVIAIRAINSDADVLHPVIEGERVDVCVKYVRETGTTVTGTIIGYA